MSPGGCSAFGLRNSSQENNADFSRPHILTSCYQECWPQGWIRKKCKILVWCEGADHRARTDKKGMPARPSLEAYLLPLTRTEVKKAGPVGHPCCGLGGLLFQVAHTGDPSKGLVECFSRRGLGLLRWWTRQCQHLRKTQIQRRSVATLKTETEGSFPTCRPPPHPLACVSVAMTSTEAGATSASCRDRPSSLGCESFESR